MNLINAPIYVQWPLRLLAPVAGLMPKTIMNLRYRRWTGKNVNWKEPRNLEEYFLAEMMNAAADPERLKVYAEVADKIAVRDYVAERVGEKALTKLYGVWWSADDVDFDKLPVPCVLKTNNGCGTNIIVRTREDFVKKDIRRRLANWLKYPYGRLSGQPHYSAIRPGILAEEYLEQNPGTDDLPIDYKFFCFNGEPQFILYYSDRKENGHVCRNRVYDTEWKAIEGACNYPLDHDVPAPEAFEEMKEMARALSRDFKVARIDFYCIGKRPVFGEITLSPDVIMNFTPEFLKTYFDRYCR